MIRYLDQDIRIRRKTAWKSYKHLMSNKYYKKGHDAAKEGKSKDEIPYQLTPEMWSILKKRTWWLMGFEDKWLNKKDTEKRLKNKKKKDKKNKKKYSYE